VSVQKIQFIASSRHVAEVRERPKPAYSLIPDWYKNMPIFSTGDKLDLAPYPTVTGKRCIPMLDGITAGYIVTLWADILVKNVNGFMETRWTTDEPVLESWGLEQSSTYKVPDGFALPVFKYLHGWIPKTPAGYSCYITHPVGYPNLPIRTITGIIDTDKLESPANSPFVIREDFEGIIEKGTPMFQIIPFKRDEWEAEYLEQSTEDTILARERLNTTIWSSYGRNLRTKKSYK